MKSHIHRPNGASRSRTRSECSRVRVRVEIFAQTNDLGGNTLCRHAPRKRGWVEELDLQHTQVTFMGSAPKCRGESV